MQGPCDAYGWYFDLDRSPCPRRENSTSSHQEHLRLCGEDCCLCSIVINQVGSPPPARGRPCYSNGGVYFRRITSACAGKTRYLRSSLPLSRDHPRLRGEDTSNPTYIHALSLSWPTPAFTFFLVTQKTIDSSPLALPLLLSSFILLYLFLTKNAIAFFTFIKNSSYVSPKTIPFVPLFFDFIWYNREQRLGAFPRPLYSIFKKG